LYAESGKLLHLRERRGEGLNFDKSKYDDAIKFIHENSGISPEDLRQKSARELINETNRILSESISKSLQSGLKHEVPQTMTTALQENVFTFSGMKTYHQLKEASQLLVTEKGEIKPFQKFKEDVEKIHSKYNERYLEVEYNFAVHSAQMAVKWNEYEQDGEDYNLQYRTSGDDKVRADHAVLNRTTLPLSDPFWDSYTPPIDWGCRCTIVQVLKNKYPESNSAEAQELGKKATTRISADGTNKLAMFRFNPGKTMKIFPDKHPYLSRDGSPLEVKQAQKVVENLAQKSTAAIEKEKYLREMKHLLKKKIEMDIDSDTISVGFTKFGNKHLYNDTIWRTKEFNKNDLKKLNTLLKESTFVKSSELYKERKNDDIKKFYYFKDKDKEIYYNVAEMMYKGSIYRLLYSITNMIQ